MLKDLVASAGAMITGLGQIKPPQWNDDLAEFVNKEYAERQTERLPFEMQWRLVGEFIDGNQYLEVNSFTNALEEIPKSFWWTEREVYNQMATIYETRVSKMSRQKPSMKTRPASSDDVDISSAKIESMLLKSNWADQEMDDLYEDAVGWLELTGTVLLKPTWNPRKGRLIYDPQQQPYTPSQQGDPIDQNDGELLGQQRQPVQQKMYEGDLETILVPSYEFFPDSSARRGMKGVRSAIHAKAYHINEIYDMHGIEVEAEDVDVMTLQRSATKGGGINYIFGTIRSQVIKLKDHAVLKEYYEMPCNKYPEGRLIVVCGKKTLYEGPLPYKLGKDGEKELPFIRIVSNDRPGCFWGRTVSERCMSIQRRYNALRNRKAEYLNLAAIGQWYAPVGSVDEGTEFSNAPGNIIWYRPGINGAKPEPVQWPSLPVDFSNEEQSLLAEFTAVSGVSELSRYAEAPSGVKSGVALGIAKEQDDTRLSSSVSRIANGIIALGRYWIRLQRQFVQEPRILRSVGANREADVREWTQSDLRSDDVFIENMSALAETPSQRRQMVFDLLGAGLFARPELSSLDEESREKVFQLLEFGHWETGDEDDRTLQKSRARTENRRMMQDGTPQAVMDFDDHLLHIEMHNRQRMQADYEQLLQTPIGKQVNEFMMAHIAEHIQLALAAMPKEPVEPAGEGGKPGEKKKEAKSA